MGSRHLVDLVGHVARRVLAAQRGADLLAQALIERQPSLSFTNSGMKNFPCGRSRLTMSESSISGNVASER